MRTVGAQRTVKELAEGRRHFREVIRDWSNADLRDSESRYREILTGTECTEETRVIRRFYAARIYALRNEIIIRMRF